MNHKKILNFYKKFLISFIFIFCIPIITYANISQPNKVTADSTAQGQYIQGLGGGIYGTATAFQFSSTNSSVWATSPNWSGGFATLTECDNETGNEFTGGTNPCSNRVRHRVDGNVGGSINISSDIVKISFPSGITMNPDKFYVFAYYLGSGNTTAILNGLSGSPVSGQGCFFVCNIIKDTYWVLNGPQRLINITTDVTTSGTWHSDIVYVVSGHIEINSGVTLTIEPGTIIKFDEDSSLTVNGSLIAEGEENSGSLGEIFFTSLADDAVGGDTNGDNNSTYPLPGDWDGITIGSGGDASFDYATIRYGGTIGQTEALLYNNGGTIDFKNSSAIHGTTYGIKNISGTINITTDSDIKNSEIGFNNYGIYVGGGTVAVSDTNIHDNSVYGVYNNTVSTINAENNYWGDSTGPYHVSTNTGGLGDVVSNYVDFDPWNTNLHYANEEFFDCLPNDCFSVDNNELRWKNDNVSSYTTELLAAISTWDALGEIDLVEDNSTPTIELKELPRDDVIWKGKWIPEDTPDSINLNTYFLDLDTSNQVQNTITHELGHALGLWHSFTGNVMYENQTSQTSLGSQDLSDYNYLWQ